MQDPREAGELDPVLRDPELAQELDLLLHLMAATNQVQADRLTSSEIDLLLRVDGLGDPCWGTAPARCALR